MEDITENGQTDTLIVCIVHFIITQYVEDSKGKFDFAAGFPGRKYRLRLAGGLDAASAHENSVMGFISICTLGWDAIAALYSSTLSRSS